MVGQISMAGGRGKRAAAVVAFAALVVALGACSDDDGDDDAGATEQTDDGNGEATEAAEAADDSELVAAEERADAAEAELEAANATLAETEASLEAANADLAAAEAANADLAAQLEVQTLRADGAEATLSNIAAEFPVTISAALTPEFDPIGNYTMSFAEAYCEGTPTCGNPPAPIGVQIIQGVNGLELVVPGLFTAGLLGVSGELVAGSDSNTIASCGDQPVSTRVLTTLFGEGVIIDIEGNRTLSGLAASVFVQAAASEACPAISVFYGAELVPA